MESGVEAAVAAAEVEAEAAEAGTAASSMRGFVVTNKASTRAFAEP